MGNAHHQCAYCQGGLRISTLTCEDCGLSLGGDFFTPRLYRLESEDQRFVELFVLASGSLKQMAALLGVSYPTVRSRLDRLIEKLKNEQRKDAQRKQRILEDIEAGRVSAKRGMRMIDAI
ncbi:MAG: DUF2089 domain-containing protein [Gammaproteobacteria bacterium]|nr:DUF2089 domain-containing protein [Gammaproteobacteria bacterium]